MKLTRMLPIAPLGIVLLSSAAEGAPSPAPNRTLDVEVIDTSKAGSETTRFALAIDGQKWAKLSIPAGDLSYQLDARSDPATGGALPIAFSLHRGDHRPGSPLRIDVDMAVSVPIGMRTVVATAARPDGSKLEIALRAH